jgi:hypothetical protein
VVAHADVTIEEAEDGARVGARYAASVPKKVFASTTKTLASLEISSRTAARSFQVASREIAPAINVA